jgi:hypothetical protein
MENWVRPKTVPLVLTDKLQGLITGRTTAYLIDDEKSDIAAKKRVAEVASHEVAHQWYGYHQLAPTILTFQHYEGLATSLLLNGGMFYI